MNFSLNEVESTAKRAARGAGYPWGLSEEAGKATRWLAARGIDGCSILCNLLNTNAAAKLSAHTPDCETNLWQANSKLCPLICGAALMDREKTLEAHPITMKNVMAPILLIPAAAWIAGSLQTAISLEIDDEAAVTNGTDLQYHGTSLKAGETVRISLGGVLENANVQKSRAEPNNEGWNGLNAFAYRTYAPATDESRLLGAGAGLSDND